MVPQRLSVKFFVKGSKPIDLAPFTPLFHRWIQKNTVEGLLIDVADYKHVPDGPGVLLIGHEVDYGLDLTGGKPGLLVRRKRYAGQGTLADILRDTLRKAVLAAKAITADGTTGVEFNPATVEISLIDRLVSPNTDEAFTSVRPEIEPVLAELFEEGCDLRRGSNDPRASLSLVATAKKASDWEILLDRLDAKPAGV